MKTNLLVKLLTLVSFLMLGVGAFAANEDETKDACKVRVIKEKSSEATQTCAARQNTANDAAGKPVDSPLSPAQKDACKKTELDISISAECGDKESQKDKNVTCKQSLKDYDDAMKKTDEECNRLNVKDIQECRDKAKSCAKGLDSFGSDDPDSESAAQSIGKLINIYGQMQGATSGNTNLSGCAIENDDKAAEKEERIDDKITKIREDIQDLKEKATSADKEFADKKQDIEKDMLDVEKDADKAKFEKLNKTQEDAARLQKAILISEKKRRDNLVTIQDIQIDIANFSFAHQQLNLSLSDEIISKKCRDNSIATMNAKVKGVADPKTGKVIKPKFTQTESLQFTKDLRLEETNCLQGAALQRQAKTKELIDNKRKLSVKVDQLTTSNADEEKAINAEIKQIEAMKAIATAEDSKALDTKLKKLNSLNSAVKDMEKHVADKKAAYAEKSKAKEDLISKLVLDRQNVKAKFSKVSTIVSTSGRAASVYLNQCCTSKAVSENHSDCSRVLSIEPDGKTAKTKTSGTKK